MTSTRNTSKSVLILLYRKCVAYRSYSTEYRPVIGGVLGIDLCMSIIAPVGFCQKIVWRFVETIHGRGQWLLFDTVWWGWLSGVNFDSKQPRSV